MEERRPIYDHEAIKLALGSIDMLAITPAALRNATSLIGYAGTALTIMAYAMKNTIPLRLAGIASSVAFMTYGYLTESFPILLMKVVSGVSAGLWPQEP